MILTPRELLNWIKAGKTFSVVDLRPKQLKSKDRLLGMQGRLSNSNIIPAVKNDLVLICQFGIVTEGLILEKKLTNTYSLLGGSEAWNHFYKNDFDFSKYSRQIILPEIGLDGQNKIINSKIAIIGMGGLGCPASQSLVAAGVGHLKIIDGDLSDERFNDEKGGHLVGLRFKQPRGNRISSEDVKNFCIA